MERRIAAMILAVVVLAFALFVWPTTYAYDHVQRGASEILLRRNRVSGEVAYFDQSAGWIAPSRLGHRPTVHELAIAQAAWDRQTSSTTLPTVEDEVEAQRRDVENGWAREKDLEKIIERYLLTYGPIQK
jgi:hypothetical protein